MKRIKQIVLGIVVMLCIAFIPTSKSMATTAVVNTDTLNLRKEASTDSTVLELLNLGEKLDVIEQSGDWVKIRIRGITGYVHKDYVKIEEEEPIMQQEPTTEEKPQEQNPETQTETEGQNQEEQNSQEQPTETEINPTENENNNDSENNNQNQQEQTNQFVVKEATLKTDTNVFILPLINASKIQNLSKGNSVIIMDEVNGWYYVQTETVNGWVRKEAISDGTNNENTNPEQQENEGTSNGETPSDETTNEDQANTVKETPIEEKIMYVNYSSIYVRKGPSTEEEIVDSLILNDEVTVVAEVEDWYKVKIGNTTGYIAKRLLSNTEQQDTSRGAEERTEEASNQVETTQVETTNVASNQEQNTNTSRGQEIVNYAKQYLGCKYVYGGSGPSTFDCSGFTMYVYQHFGISLSHSAIAQSKNGTYVSKQDLQLGDLVFFKDYETMDGIGHCGIYIGDGNFIHASSGTGYCVKISTLLSGSYYNRYETARRLI